MNTQASGNKKRGAAEKSGKGGAVDVPGKKKKKEKFDRKVRHKRTILGFFLLRLLSLSTSLFLTFLPCSIGVLLRRR